jgi:hypothetical protein
MRTTRAPLGLLALTALLTFGACNGDKDEEPVEADTDTDTDSDTDTDTDADTDADTDSDTDTDTDTDTDVVIVPSPDLYSFPSRNDPTIDSVAYTGQTFRHLLIEDLTAHIDGLTARLNSGFVPSPGDIEEEIEFWFSFDSSTSGQVPFTFLAGNASQTVYDDVSTDKDLVGKLAGNDPVGQHKDWSTEFVGWSDPELTFNNPEGLLYRWFADLDDASTDWAAGTYPLDPAGNPVEAVYITAEGRDLKQLIEKFLLGAVAFSQGADDYLDDDEPGKGLLSDHTTVNAAGYTDLEHQWDEGFGYFGAAVGYPQMSDDDIADIGTFDIDGNSAIDLVTEVCWGNSTNAAKRDRGSDPTAATDFTADAWTGFYEGRLLLANTTGELTPAELDALRAHRDTALAAWENAIASTVVHYINATLQDMNDFDTVDYSFTDHAKHWSEMKGFALGLQFNPHSPLSDADFAQMHTLMADQPVLPTADQATRDAYAADLRTARTLIGNAYGFDAANLGDDNGENGW